MTYSVVQDEIPFLAFVLCGGTWAKRRLSVTTKLPSSGVFVALSNALSVLCLFAATHQSVAVPFRVVFPVVFAGLYNGEYVCGCSRKCLWFAFVCQNMFPVENAYYVDMAFYVQGEPGDR